MKLAFSNWITLAVISSVAGKALVTNQVTQDLAKNSLTPILIQLNQVEPPVLSSNSRMATEDDLDFHAEQVVATLTKHSEESQGSVKALLEEAKKKGTIKDYRHYYISNTFAVEAPKELIEKISKLSEVEEISSNKKVASMIKDISDQEASTAADIPWEGKEPHWKSQGSVKALLEEAKKKGTIRDYRHYYISNTFAVEAPKELIEKISKLSEVEEISSNKKVASMIKDISDQEASTAADIPWEGKEPHWSLKYINATNLPKRVYTAASKLRYANADTGVDFEHPVLVKNYLGYKNGKFSHDYCWWDANKNLANATKPNLICGIDSQKPCDDRGHGTHCMGTTLGGLNLGVSPTTKWMACKNMDQGFGSPETYLGCLQFFLAPTNLYGIKPKPHLRPHVVGNSYGCPGVEGCSRSTFKYALRALKSAGIFMSVSAGNDGGGGCSTVNSPPAVDPNSFNVAASGYLTNDRAAFSSLGPVPERTLNAIDITAPGVNITSSIPGGKFGIKAGTSMASPHISGVALLVIAACPHLSRRVDLIAKVIHNSATPLYSKLGCGGDTEKTLPNNEYGYGIVNVAKALELCKKTY
ncbi:subtilisin-like protein [Neoconidiobolus thromboides FSU 785]|nr:subtilisin-like protein [Neoconidiobolus thromboides FSU 785]